MKQSNQAGAGRATIETQVQLSKDLRTVTARIPMAFNRHKGRKHIITPPGTQSWTPSARVDSALIKAIVRAHRWREMLETGEHASAAELAKATRVNDSYLSRVLRLTLLAPDIVQAILDGSQSPALELKALLEPFPAEWNAQREHWRLA